MIFFRNSHSRVTLVLSLEGLLVLVGEISFTLTLYFRAEYINWSDTLGLSQLFHSPFLRGSLEAELIEFASETEAQCSFLLNSFPEIVTHRILLSV